MGLVMPRPMASAASTPSPMESRMPPPKTARERSVPVSTDEGGMPMATVHPVERDRLNAVWTSLAFEHEGDTRALVAPLHQLLETRRRRGVEKRLVLARARDAHVVLVEYRHHAVRRYALAVQHFDDAVGLERRGQHVAHFPVPQHGHPDRNAGLPARTDAERAYDRFNRFHRFSQTRNVEHWRKRCAERLSRIEQLAA